MRAHDSSIHHVKPKHGRLITSLAPNTPLPLRSRNPQRHTLSFSVGWQQTAAMLLYPGLVPAQQNNSFESGSTVSHGTPLSKCAWSTVKTQDAVLLMAM